MENEWLELAYINFDKVILHGQLTKVDARPIAVERQIEQVLTQEQRREAKDLRLKHEREMLELLRSFVND